MEKSNNKISRKAYLNKLKYNREFNRSNYKSISLRLNYKKEREVINWLLQLDDLHSYLVDLIRKDIERWRD